MQSTHYAMTVIEANPRSTIAS